MLFLKFSQQIIHCEIKFEELHARLEGSPNFTILFEAIKIVMGIM